MITSHEFGTAYLVGLIRQYKSRLLWLLAIQLGCAALMSLQPLFYQRIVSLVVNGGSYSLMAKGRELMAMLVFLYVSLCLLRSLGGAIANRFSADLLKQLQVSFFEKLNQLPLQYFQHLPSGEFMAKFNTDVSQTQALISHLVPMVLREAAIILTVIVILFVSCPATLAVMSILIVVLTAMAIYKLNKILEGYAREQRTQWADLNRVLDESVHGIDTLKIVAGEKERNRYFEGKTASFRQLSVRAGIIVSIFSPMVDLLSKIGVLLLIFIAYWMIAEQTIMSDQFLLFFFYIGLLDASAASLINTTANLQPQLVSASNLSDFFSRFPEETDKPENSQSIDVPLDIEICNLSFSYPGGRQLYNRANLFIPARSITVIHGPSGSGKSTLINLLLRFYPPGDGVIRMGKKDIRCFARDELRKKISVVTQFHYIFNETLKQNLAIAKPGASDEEIMEALEMAQLGNFLRRLQHGIHEILDPRGKSISGGERQRICIARLLLKKAPIIILDEPWTNLDLAARELLIKLINQLKCFATILILSHACPPSLKADSVFTILPEKGLFSLKKQAVDMAVSPFPAIAQR